MKDFVIVRLGCPFCGRWEIAKVLTQADIDLVDARSGDPRVKVMEFSIGKLTKENIPIGVVKGHVVNYVRDLTFMCHLLKDGGD
ncbi:MAG TPA: hypothetical protein ENG66_05605 [Thermococcus sp.]|nr:hypothetical protein [Thermococcus sp.]